MQHDARLQQDQGARRQETAATLSRTTVAPGRRGHTRLNGVSGENRHIDQRYDHHPGHQYHGATTTARTSGGRESTRAPPSWCCATTAWKENPHPKDELAITPQEFEKEMQQIKDAGFAVIPMQDFLAWRRGDKDIPPKSCVISIDDGYVSGYDTAWPILKKFGYPFTMFVYINYINSGGKSVSGTSWPKCGMPGWTSSATPTTTTTSAARRRWWTRPR